MPKRYQHTEADLLYQRRRDAQIPDATRHAVNFRNRAIALLASDELTPEESARVAAIETLAFANEMQRLAFKRAKRPDGARVRLLYPDPEALATFKSEVDLLAKFEEWVAGRPNRVKVAA